MCCPAAWRGAGSCCSSTGARLGELGPEEKKQVTAFSGWSVFEWAPLLQMI